MTFEEQDRLQCRAFELMSDLRQCVYEVETWTEMGVFEIGLRHMTKLMAELKQVRTQLGHIFPEDLCLPYDKLTKPWCTPVMLPGGEYDVELPLDD